MHKAVTYFTMYSYNFCWPVRTLQRLGRQRTPAMSAGLADHVGLYTNGSHFRPFNRNRPLGKFETRIKFEGQNSKRAMVSSFEFRI